MWSAKYNVFKVKILIQTNGEIHDISVVNVTINGQSIWQFTIARCGLTAWNMIIEMFRVRMENRIGPTGSKLQCSGFLTSFPWRNFDVKGVKCLHWCFLVWGAVFGFRLKSNLTLLHSCLILDLVWLGLWWMGVLWLTADSKWLLRMTWHGLVYSSVSWITKYQ